MEEFESEEMPHNHKYQGIIFAGFFVVWILDSFILQFSTFFLFQVPVWLHIIPALAIFILALYLVDASHKDLFHAEGDGLVTKGIFSHVRHPLYLGSALAYLAFAIGTISIASIIVWVIIFAAYNAMANYEEKKLEEKFGEEYLEYKKEVSKWFLH
jgi:protein-S-isoprenylcysteine O-methyltransferase Ste14